MYKERRARGDRAKGNAKHSAARWNHIPSYLNTVTCITELHISTSDPSAPSAYTTTAIRLMRRPALTNKTTSVSPTIAANRLMLTSVDRTVGISCR